MDFLASQTGSDILICFAQFSNRQCLSLCTCSVACSWLCLTFALIKKLFHYAWLMLSVHAVHGQKLGMNTILKAN